MTKEGKLFSYGCECHLHCSNLSLSQGPLNSFPTPPCVPSHSSSKFHLTLFVSPSCDWWPPLHTAHCPKVSQILTTPLLSQTLLRDKKSDWSSYFLPDQGKTERCHFIPPLLRTQRRFSNKKLFFKEKYKYRLRAEDVLVPLTLQMEGANPSSLVPLLLWAGMELSCPARVAGSEECSESSDPLLAGPALCFPTCWSRALQAQVSVTSCLDHPLYKAAREASWTPYGWSRDMGKNRDSSSAQHWEEFKMQRAVCARAVCGGTKSRRGAQRFCGRHPELPSCFWQPQRVGPTPKSSCLPISGGKSLWEKQFSAAVVIFKPEA